MLQSLLTSCLLLLGADFSEQCTDIIVPAAETAGSQTYTIEKFFTVVDDDLHENEQSFVLIAELGDDIPSNCFVEMVGLSDCRCFQTQVGETECFGDGRSGATKIRITDNDCKKYYVMNLEVIKTELLWLCLVIDFLSQ